jgi:hypothetical protein
VLKAVGVNHWDDLKNKMVWAEHTWSEVSAITGVDTGVRFSPKKEWEHD